MDARELAIAIARARIAIGIGALVAPGAASSMLAGRQGRGGAAKLLARMVGSRDLTLGLGVVIALDRGAPVRGWLEASAVCDGVDLVACLLAREAMPGPSVKAMVPLAGTSALACAALSRRLDPPPPADPGHPEAVATGHPPERVEAERPTG
jgi:hypothetical protein